MKRIYLIDTENVGKSFLGFVSQLTLSDVLVVFNNRIRRDDFSKAILNGLSKVKASVRKVYIENAMKNAMDFSIMCELGRLMEENGNSCEYYIVSNDRAFDVASDLAKANGISSKVKRIGTLEDSCGDEERIKQEEERIRRLLPEKYSKRVVKTVQQGFDASKTHGQFVKFIKKHLKYDEADILQRVTPLLEEKYGTLS